MSIKPGRRIGYSTLALGFAATIAATTAAMALGAQSPSAALSERVGRIVGVFDETSGKPIEGAQIRDLASGSWAATTATGTVDLFFVKASTVLIRITKLGYEPLTLPVDNSAESSLPLTLTLKATAQPIDGMVTTAVRRRGPADTVRKLEMIGFYDRRQASGAPASAFVTQDKIERLTLLSDLPKVTGRPICTENLYIDGVRVDVPRLTGPKPGLRGQAIVAPPLKDGLDALLGTYDVLAIELYRVADTPSQFNKTRPQNTGACGTTLIWTK
jgi:hypothetical protein